MQSVPSVQKDGSTTYYGSLCVTVCALMFGGATFGESGNANERPISQVRRRVSCGTFQPRHNQSRSSCWSNFNLIRPRIKVQKALRAIVQMFPDQQQKITSQEAAGHDAKDVNHLELLRRARLWNHKASFNDAMWEAAVRHF